MNNKSAITILQLCFIRFRLRSAIETLGIPVFLGGMSRGLLGRNNPINMRQARKEALKEADVVILGGSVADFRMGYGRVLNPSSKVIAINRSKEQLFKNANVFWEPTLAIQADAAKFFVDLVESVRHSSFKVDQTWVEKLRARDVEKEEKARLMAKAEAEQHLNPLRILHDLENSLDDDTVFVADGGDFVGSAAYILRPRGPLRWLDPGNFKTKKIKQR